jgi:hypothetical protein
MPYDPHAFEEMSDEEAGLAGDRRRRFSDFDCPGCDANNPYEDGFGDGDEVLCYYCGLEYRVTVNEEGRLRLREV